MKKRKNIMLKTACAVIFTIIVAIVLVGASWQPETKVVKTLLERRTDVMENVLSGKISYEAGEEQLKEIETGKLLSDDLAHLQSYGETDVDRVEKMEVLHIERTSRLYDMMTFQADICWTCYGVEGRYEETGSYQVGVSKLEEKYKLISLKIQGSNH